MPKKLTIPKASYSKLAVAKFNATPLRSLEAISVRLGAMPDDDAGDPNDAIQAAVDNLTERQLVVLHSNLIELAADQWLKNEDVAEWMEPGLASLMYAVNIRRGAR